MLAMGHGLFVFWFVWRDHKYEEESKIVNVSYYRIDRGLSDTRVHLEEPI